jgi:RNA polymerase sigma-70 factor (ECF subfamily)
MNGAADRLAGVLVSAGVDIEREFEARLADSSALAFRVAYSVLRHRQDAEDAAQEAFARAYRKFSQLRDRDRFRAWLVRMTWRIALDFRRADRRRAFREDAAGDPGVPAGFEDHVIAAERSTRLWRAIDALPEKLRLVVVLVSIEEQSVKDVAALVGVPEGTIKSRLFDARQKLKELLG